MTSGVVPLRGGSAAELVERIREVRAAGGVPLTGDDRWPEEQWRAVARLAAEARPAPGDAWATLTSGSSGSPRIVLRTEDSWAASFPAVAGLLDAGPEDALALPAPPASSLTLFSIAHALAGGPRPLLPRGHALVAADFADATCFHGTPQAFRALLDAGAPPRLRAALIGGSHLDPALRARAEALGIRVAAYYGAAELSFVAVDAGDGLVPFPGVEAEVRDGVLWVRSPYLASGSAGGSGPLERDGAWATVGDRAELADGRLRLLGRADDAILSASATVVPEEVEAVLRSLPGVRDAVVFGLPVPRVGALVAAAIEPEGAEAPGVAALRAAAAERLAPAHLPRRWFVAELPRTVSGKPARAELVQRVVAGEVTALDR